MTVGELKEKLSEIPWIDIREELPEDGTWNLFTDGKRISIERYKFDAMDHFWPSGRWFDLEDVIAWMPLPITVWRERAEELSKVPNNTDDDDNDIVYADNEGALPWEKRGIYLKKRKSD